MRSPNDIYSMPKIIHCPLQLRTPRKKEFRTEFPIRSPIQTAEAIRRFIRGKIICDVGCASGDMVLQFSKYAKYAYGINWDQNEAATARERGADVVVGDVFNMDLPYADYYFIYWGPGEAVPFLDRMRNHPHPCTILASGHEDQPFLEWYAKEYGATKILTFPYREKETCNMCLAPSRGHWRLVMFKKE